MIRRDTKDSKVTSETAGGKCELDPLLKSTKEKRKYCHATSKEKQAESIS